MPKYIIDVNIRIEVKTDNPIEADDIGSDFMIDLLSRSPELKKKLGKRWGSISAERQLARRDESERICEKVLRKP